MQHSFSVLPASAIRTALISLLLAIAGGIGGCASAPPPSQPPLTTPPPVEERDPIDPPQLEAPEPPPSAQSNVAGVLLAQSETLRSKGELPRALALVERAIRLEPNRGDLWIQLGRLRFDAGELNRAEQNARKGIALARRDAAVQRTGWLLLADISEARGDLDGAAQLRARWQSIRG